MVICKPLLQASQQPYIEASGVRTVPCPGACTTCPPALGICQDPTTPVHLKQRLGQNWMAARKVSQHKSIRQNFLLHLMQEEL